MTRKNKTPNRRLPFNTKKLEAGLARLGIDTERGGLEFNRARKAALVGYVFLRRVSESASLELRSVTFGANDGLEYVRIIIRKSKNDRDEMGVFRSLNATNETMCPVTRMKNGCYNARGNPRAPRYLGRRY